MRLTLVDNLVLPDRDNLDALDLQPHLGLISLGAVAQHGGHHVSIVDPKRLLVSGELAYDQTLYERMAERILGHDPDAVGFTTLGCSFLFTLKVARQLKRARPTLPVLLGGPHATILDRPILDRYPEFDVVVRHEAESTLPHVLTALHRRDFADVPGVTWRDTAGGPVQATAGLPMIKDLDTLPLPAYDLYPVEDLGLEFVRVEAGRGCPFACTFCSTASFFQRAYRLKSASRLLRELDLLHERYGFVDFKLAHDLFTVNRAKVLEFCRAVEPRGYRWRVSARVDCVDEDLLTAMAAAGCRQIYFGIETGSPRLQRVVRKGLDLGLVEPTLDVTERLGIRATASFITGYPDEEAEDQDQTLDMVGRCLERGPSCQPQLHVLLPEPGTELDRVWGQRIEYDGFRTHFNARLLAADDEACVRLDPRVFSTYYHYPTAVRKRATFAAEAVDVLQRIGHPLAAYTLRFYGGRLSRFVGALGDWAARTGHRGPLTVADVATFVAAAVGVHHHLTSLMRYAVTLAELRPGTGAIASAAFAPDRSYRLSRSVRVLEDVHDGLALLERIASGGVSAAPLTEADAGPRGPEVIQSRGGEVTSDRVDPGVCLLLRLFERPRRWQSVRRRLRARGMSGPLGKGLIVDLVRLGVLEPAVVTSRGRRPRTGHERTLVRA